MFRDIGEKKLSDTYKTGEWPRFLTVHEIIGRAEDTGTGEGLDGKDAWTLINYIERLETIRRYATDLAARMRECKDLREVGNLATRIEKTLGKLRG